MDNGHIASDKISCLRHNHSILAKGMYVRARTVTGPMFGQTGRKKILPSVDFAWSPKNLHEQCLLDLFEACVLCFGGSGEKSRDLRTRPLFGQSGHTGSRIRIAQPKRPPLISDSDACTCPNRSDEDCSAHTITNLRRDIMFLPSLAKAKAVIS